MLAIFRKEVNSFFNSLIAYVIIAVFLTVMGLFVWVFPDTNVLDFGYADLSPLFGLAPYVFLFLIPAVTMRTFAEEKKAGTLELLLTRPVSDWAIIGGKYLACLAIILLALLPTLLYYYTVHTLGNPVGNVDSAGVAGSYVGLIGLAAVFTAIGVFASSLTDNQITAFVIAVFLGFLLHSGFGYLARLGTGPVFYFLQQWGIDYHYQALSRGLIDSRNLLYFGSVIAALLLATRLVLASRRW